jgi:predicted DNA-binding helix-hairpin-helix protein
MNGFKKLLEFGQYMSVEMDEDPSKPTEKPSSNALSSPPTCEVETLHKSTNRSFSDFPISMASLPTGQRIPLLKTVLTSACERNCNYCAFRSGRDFRRQNFKSEELAKTFMQMWQAGIVHGLFLSSGVAGGGVHTQDRLLATAEILRQKFHYTGYLHLKVMPGAEQAQVERAMELADRVSVNLEAPTGERLAELAPEKNFFDELMQPLRWVDQIRHELPSFKGWNGRWPSSTTQFVVGGASESDEELVRATEYLHQKLHLTRIYFSGFNPVPDTPLEDQPPVNPWRRYRLYQASFLLRDYRFIADDLIFNSFGDLPVEIDPKTAWAEINLAHTPVEINRADYNQLIRVPGIGLRGARKILSMRKLVRFRSLNDLRTLGIIADRAAPYILLDGRHPPTQGRLL